MLAGLRALSGVCWCALQSRTVTLTACSELSERPSLLIRGSAAYWYMEEPILDFTHGKCHHGDNIKSLWAKCGVKKEKKSILQMSRLKEIKLRVMCSRCWNIFPSVSQVKIPGLFGWGEGGGCMFTYSWLHLCSGYGFTTLKYVAAVQ